MSIVVTSTADTPEQVAAVIERAGMKPEAVETTEKPAEKPAAESQETPAPTEAKPEGKTEDVSETPEKQEQPKEEQKPGDDEPDEPERDEKGRFKGKGVQKKIDKLTKEKHEERDKRVAAETRLADLQKQLDELKTTAAKPEDTKPEKKDPEKPAEKPAEPKPEPKLKDFIDKFETYEEAVEAWEDARSEWRYEKREAKLKAEITDLEKKLEEKGKAASEADRKARIAQEQWDEKVEAARERYSDWDATVEAAKDAKIMINAVQQAAIMESDLSADILYHLAKHPEEAKRISGLSDIAAIREIGKLEAKLSAASEKKPEAEKKAEEPAKKTPEAQKPRPSAAPAPITPVGTTSAAATGFDPYKDADRMTPQQWAEWREKNRKKTW